MSDGTITAKDVEELSKALSVGNGQPDQILVDTRTLQEYQKAFWMGVPKFEEEDWIFDGETLYQVIEDRHIANLIVVILSGPGAGLRTSIDRYKVKKVPKGSKIETLRTLFGKK